MKMRAWAMGWMLLWGSAGMAGAAEWFVATNGSDAANGASWTTAKQTIQAGIDAASSNDVVWVSNGFYATGGRVAVGTWSNRVAIDRAIAVRSANGPETTFIAGDGMRCAYVVNGAVLSGFTLTNGITASGCEQGATADHNGGGALCEASGVLTHCVLTGNWACYSGGGSSGGILNDCALIGNSTWTLGGGSSGGTLNRCVLSGNSASMQGGGANGGTLNNCLLTGNYASYGGGAGSSTLNNCTVADNSGWDGGGVILSTLKNGIVYGNIGDGDKSNYRECAFTNSCTTPDPGGTENITDDPQFVDTGAGNYRLWATSPCINRGGNAYSQGTTDLDGNQRISNGTVDMGAYEVQTQMAIQPTSTNLFSDAASGLAIDVWACVPWTATTNADWIAITSGESGTTNGAVVFSVASNGAATARTGAVLVAGGGLVRTCAVIQAATGPFMALGPEQFVLSGDAASGLIFAVTPNVAWTATTNVPWLAITAGASGISNGTVTFNVASNGLAQPRAGAIQVSGDGIARTCTVVQAEGGAFAADWHVATNGSDAFDGRTWTMAKRTIQAAVDAATAGSTVWVSNGTYVGLVTVNKGVTVKSMNGAEVATIQGANSRCAYMNHAAAVISGFTLTGGTADWGGGAYVDAGTLENCIIRDNEAHGVTESDSDEWGGHVVSWNTCHGGGVYGGTLRNCIIQKNTATSYEQNGATAIGGGTYGSDLHNCLVRNNNATAFTPTGLGTGAGAGCHGGTLRNCTIIGNQAWAAATASGGGCHDSGVLNSIVKDNTSQTTFGGTVADDVAGGSVSYSCSPGLSSGGGNISDDPLFMDPGADNYRLATGSPCIDAGNNGDVVGANDLDGNSRIANGTVDMGAYEVPRYNAWYVATNGNDAADGTSWATAKQTIQAGVDSASAGDTVWVSKGVYSSGGRAIQEYVLTNLVAIDKPITVESIAGAEATIIQATGTSGTAPLRCAYVGDDAVLSGFTLAGGTTYEWVEGYDYSNETSAAGAYCAPSAVVNHCILSNNASSWSGGAVLGGTLNDCILTGNIGYDGGGAYQSTLNRCILQHNYAFMVGGGGSACELNQCLVCSNTAQFGGGGIHGGVANNCTVVGNHSIEDNGGGGFFCEMNNCIVFGNTVGLTWPNYYTNCTLRSSCTVPDPGGTGNITNDPKFVDAAAGDYRLARGSPCINAGNNGYVEETTDLDGNPRFIYGTVDMGAYEFRNATSYETWAAGITNGLTNATDCAAGDGVPNLLRYAAGSSGPMMPDGLAVLQIGVGVFPSVIFNRNSDAADLAWIVESAEAMSSGAVWRGVATNVGGSWGGATNVEESGTGNPVECTVTDPVALGTNRFLRLRVSRP